MILDNYFSKYVLEVVGYEKKTGIAYKTILEFDDANQAYEEYLSYEEDGLYDVSLYRRMNHSYVD